VNVAGIQKGVDPRVSATASFVLGLGAFVFALLRLVTENNFTKYGLYFAIVLGAILAYGGFMKYQAHRAP
jgi:hypothetical protein